MKIIKDKLMEWLQDEINKETTLCNDFLKSTDRLNTLVEVQTRANQIVSEELSKLTVNNHEKL